MAKGGGGEGHYDERRRATKPKVVSGYADSPEVLAAIQKPSGVTRKPVVVVKKKKVVPTTPKPKTVKEWSDLDNSAYVDDHATAAAINRLSRPSPKGDRLSANTGSLFGFLNDNYNPFPTSPLSPIQDARNEAAASASSGAGRRFEDTLDRRRAKRKSYMF